MPDPIHHEVCTLRLEVEHRMSGPGGGPTLRLRDRASGREWLRYDCFARGAHWHLDPEKRDRISGIGAQHEPIDWVLQELREHGDQRLAEAGAAEGAPALAELQEALAVLAPALRNPPPDFDACDQSLLRARTGEKWTRFPEAVLPLWVADMDFPVAEPIRRRLQRALDIGDLGYPTYPGPTDVPRLFAERMERLFDWPVDAQRVELVSDVVQAINLCLHQFSGKGEGVIIQRPVYPPFAGSINELGRRLVDNPLRLGEAGWEQDLDNLERCAAAGARVLMLCNPHNPSGRVFRRDELEGIAEVALRHDLVVISDEIHADLVYEGARHIPIASLSEEIAARTITLYAASKAFNIAGLRCAVAHFGSEALQRRFSDYPAHLRGGLNGLGIMATAAAWRHADPWRLALLNYLQANRDFLARFVEAELPGVVCFKPEATYLAWLDCRALELAPNPGAFFRVNARVGLSGGIRFGPQGDGFVRINFATSRAILQEALERMARAVHGR